MWLGKFLDFEEDLKSLKSKIKDEIFNNIKKSRLTPLEFTIIENIFNSKQLSGYDLIKNLNRHFAGTWEARSGTIYPILSKLKSQGFLKSRTVKSPIGPLKKLYYLTEAGKEILKSKVNRHFIDQVKFMENFLHELISIYIHSFPEEEHTNKISEVKDLIKETFEKIIKKIPLTVAFKEICPECKNEIDRKVSFCPTCGHRMYSDKTEAGKSQNKKKSSL